MSPIATGLAASSWLHLGFVRLLPSTMSCGWSAGYGCMDDLFDPTNRLGPAVENGGGVGGGKPRQTLVFDIYIQSARETAWRDLFQGFQSLKAITFSASVPAILDVVGLFEDV